jgi:hypothetical protein
LSDARYVHRVLGARRAEPCPEREKRMSGWMTVDTAGRRTGGGAAPGARQRGGREVVVAHFLDGAGAGRAIRALEDQGVEVDALYVVAAGEAGLLSRIGAVTAEVDRATVVVAAAVRADAAVACLTVLGEDAEAAGVATAA